MGSMTKSMTATLVARLAEAGRVSWTDTVGGVLGSAIPDMRAEYRDVTFRHLCSHRAGLQGNIEMARAAGVPARKRGLPRRPHSLMRSLGLQQEPRGPKETTFEYSNTGYVIVGAMLETKMGAPWEALIQRTRVQSARHGAAPGRARRARLAPTMSRVGHAGRDTAAAAKLPPRWKRIRPAGRSSTIPPLSAPPGACMRTSKTCKNI